MTNAGADIQPTAIILNQEEEMQCHGIWHEKYEEKQGSDWYSGDYMDPS